MSFQQDDKNSQKIQELLNLLSQIDNDHETASFELFPKFTETHLNLAESYEESLDLNKAYFHLCEALRFSGVDPSLRIKTGFIAFDLQL